MYKRGDPKSQTLAAKYFSWYAYPPVKTPAFPFLRCRPSTPAGGGAKRKESEGGRRKEIRDGKSATAAGVLSRVAENERAARGYGGG